MHIYVLIRDRTRLSRTYFTNLKAAQKRCDELNQKYNLNYRIVALSEDKRNKEKCNEGSL